MVAIARNQRIARGLTQSDMEARTGYARDLIADWERGRHQVRLCAFLDYCQAIGLRLAILDESGREIS